MSTLGVRDKYKDKWVKMGDKKFQESAQQTLL